MADVWAAEVRATEVWAAANNAPQTSPLHSSTSSPPPPRPAHRSRSHSECRQRETQPAQDGMVMTV
eukprot:366296-Chlamydomonas_euryale.AAC.1